MSDEPKTEFEKAASSKDPGILREMLDLIRKNKKWWLIPILILLALVGVLVILGSTGAAPFIYTLF